MWSSGSVRGMTNIVKPSESYRLILQWTTPVSTKMKYNLHCGAGNSCCHHLWWYLQDIFNLLWFKLKELRYYCSIFVSFVWPTYPTNERSNMEQWPFLLIEEQIYYAPYEDSFHQSQNSIYLEMFCYFPWKGKSRWNWWKTQILSLAEDDE